MTIFHMQPSATLDWEGEYQVDDRPGMLFKGHGGILDHIDVYLGTDQGATTDGSYFVRVYRAEVDGDGLDPVPDEWQASTAYSLGDLVRPPGTANAESHYVYRCTVAGTSGGSEPAWYTTGSDAGESWSETAAEGATLSDNTVTWEVVYVGYPVNYALPEDTPTPNWIAESDHVAYAPGSNESQTWKTLDFTGADRVRLQYGEWYCVVVQWNANSSDTNNLIVVEGSITTDADHEGVCYLDGSAGVNNGPRVFEDLHFRLYETKTTLDKVSGTDAGFANKDSGGDTDPFNAGDQIGYTVQSGDALDDGTYWWKARVIDPSGSNTYSSFATTRTIDVVNAAEVSPVQVLVVLPAVTATYVSALSASVSPVASAINLPEVTATYTQEETASVSPVAVPINLPEVTATTAAAYEASVSPVAITVSLPGVTATYTSELLASVSPVTTAISLPAVTATYVGEWSASVSPLTVPINLPSVTATPGAVASVSPVAVSINLPAVTATSIGGEGPGPDPVWERHKRRDFPELPHQPEPRRSPAQERMARLNEAVQERERREAEAAQQMSLRQQAELRVAQKLAAQREEEARRAQNRRTSLINLEIGKIKEERRAKRKEEMDKIRRKNLKKARRKLRRQRKK